MSLYTITVNSRMLSFTSDFFFLFFFPTDNVNSISRLQTVEIWGEAFTGHKAITCISIEMTFSHWTNSSTVELSWDLWSVCTTCSSFLALYHTKKAGLYFSKNIDVVGKKLKTKKKKKTFPVNWRFDQLQFHRYYCRVEFTFFILDQCFINLEDATLHRVAWNFISVAWNV